MLQQNLDRFQRSNLSPAARNFADAIDPEYSFSSGFHVIFCKKNASDLTKLNQKLERVHKKVIIDDEADFATPNALINKGDVTRINALIKQLISRCDQTTTIIMNSERDKNVDFKSATSPAAMFTFIIGGNIVSRGVRRRGASQ